MEDESMLRRILDREEEPNDLPLALLKRITNDFSDENKIGEGGFGEVYKGKLQNEIIVAVKRIYVNVYTVNDKSFHHEIKSLMNTSHPNIVRFLGFCSNTHKKLIEDNLVNVNERLLCLEYIRGGSLDKHITDEFGGLEWEMCYQIVTGICKGLCYLHKERKIIHMDLKPANILLDDHMIPKITDFGLSRSNGISRTTGQHFGTPGYVAPEYKEHNIFSFECDIYSLGVIIIELITGCKSVPHEKNVLLSWTHRWSKRPTFRQTEQVTKCLEIAAHCKKPEPKDRPSICDIIRFLRISESTDGLIGQLTNKPKASSAFNIGCPSKRHNTRPNKGTVTPRCDEYLVQIAVQPQEREPQNSDKFIMRSTTAREGLRVENITTRPDEVDLLVPCERTRRQCASEGSHPQGIGSSSFFGYVERTISPSDSSTKNWICRGFVLACLLFVLSALALNSWSDKFSSLHVADVDKLSTASPGRGPLDVVIVYAFDSTDSTPAWNTVNKDIFWLVQEKLTRFAGSCLGYIYVMSTPNTYTSDMKIVDPTETEDHSYKRVSWRRMTCTKNMASGLAEAHKMISSCGHNNSIILFFSDGLINKGDFFDGTENFISKVPVHTFTLGGDAYNHVLHSIAANSPGGMFHTSPVPQRPNVSTRFSKLLDNILGGSPEWATRSLLVPFQEGGRRTW